jgi:hypothetical protein
MIAGEAQGLRGAKAQRPAHPRDGTLFATHRRMTQCANCGTPLAPDAQFCSKCGKPVVAPTPVVAAPPPAVTAPPPVVAAPPPRIVEERSYGNTAPIPVSRRSTWWIVPAVIVALVVIAWLLLAGLPFGREKTIVATETAETIAEGTVDRPPAETGTVVDVGGTVEAPFPTQTETQTMPPITTTYPPTPPATQAPPVIVEEPVVVPPPPRPVPVQTTREPEPPLEPVSQEISEAEATTALRRHLASSNPYDLSPNCLQIRSVGYRNVGYTFSVWDACVEGGGTRMLGRWRVDAKTSEVFRQGDDGRYH